MKIPSIIHQIWMNPKETKEITTPPAHIQDMMETWSDNHTDYILWNQNTMKKYIMRKDPGYLDTYLALDEWVERCDAFRYFVLHHMGGVYIDADAERLGDLNTMLEGKDAIFVKGEDGVIGNYFLASTKGNPIMKKLYKEVVVGHILVFYSTGPNYIANKLKDESEYTTIFEKDLPLKHISERSWSGEQYLKFIKKLSPLIIIMSVISLLLLRKIFL